MAVRLPTAGTYFGLQTAGTDPVRRYAMKTVKKQTAVELCETCLSCTKYAQIIKNRCVNFQHEIHRVSVVTHSLSCNDQIIHRYKFSVKYFNRNKLHSFRILIKVIQNSFK